MNAAARLTSKGRVTVPKAVHHTRGLHTGAPNRCRPSASTGPRTVSINVTPRLARR